MLSGQNMLNNLPIVILRDGVDDAQGLGHIRTNIAACNAVADILKTTIGPNGMDKLIYDDTGSTISNDGATIVQKLNIVHPAARILVQISMAQDAEVGDGTTSVVLLAAELLSEVLFLLQERVPVSAIRKGLNRALSICIKGMDALAVDLSKKTPEERRSIAKSCARTTLNSKLIGGLDIDHFAEAAVVVCDHIGKNLRPDSVQMKKVAGGSATDSCVVNGVAFKKTFSYAGYEAAPKSFDEPRILLLNHELELKAEKDNAEVRISDPNTYQRIIDAEWRIIFEKCERICETGANIVLSKLPIGDVATQYFADRGMFCAGRVPSKDIDALAKISGGNVLASLVKVASSNVGVCDTFEERQIGAERWNVFTKKNSDCCTVLLRGGATEFVEEVERSFYDAVCIVRRCLQTNIVVGGGGAVDMHLVCLMKDEAMKIAGREQLIFLAFAKALETIPRNLALNSGFKPDTVLSQLRMKHNVKGNTTAWGVDCKSTTDVQGSICDAVKKFIWEPLLVKKNALASAVEAACIILSIDETIKHPPNRSPDGPNAQ